MEDRYLTFSKLLNKISRCIQKIKDAEMEVAELKGKHVQCLYVLNDCRGGATLTRLAEMCGEDKATIGC